MKIIVLLYYKYQPIKDPTQFAQDQKDFCEMYELKGRILISHQGINGTVAGSSKNIAAYKTFMHRQKGFEDVWFKEQKLDHQPFPRLQVRPRKELVTLRKKIDFKKTGIHLEPEQVNELAEQNDVVFFDARNEIESRIGKFKGAITPNIKRFYELPKVIPQFAKKLKNKKVIMYCTGGIRCETATVLLKDAGVKEVYQINGGIYNYCNKFPDKLFEGSCFVFDDRMQVAWDENGNVIDAVDLSEDKIISTCEYCKKKSSRVINDERVTHRHLHVCCESCDKKFDISRLRSKEERT